MERKIKLLYAEDELPMRELYTRILSGNGFDVHAVEDGFEAWDCYQKERWDIVLLDMDMPKINGAGVIKLIRKSGGQVPIVILSGLNPDDLSVLDEDGGADDFVSKNWSYQTLVTRLNKRLRDTLKRVERGEQRIFKLSAKTTYDRVTRTLIVDREKHRLKPMYAKVMWMLCTRKNEVVSTTELCERLWGYESAVKRDELSTYVSNLRKWLKPDDSITLTSGHGGFYQLITPE